jgi:hypothetical protein
MLFMDFFGGEARCDRIRGFSAWSILWPLEVFQGGCHSPGHWPKKEHRDCIQQWLDAGRRVR